MTDRGREGIALSVIFLLEANPIANIVFSPDLLRYLLSKGASTEAENESGEKPADLIDPDCKELVKLFETGCV